MRKVPLVVVGLALLFGCKKREQAAPLATLSAQPQVVDPPPALSVEPARTVVPALAKQLDAIMRAPGAHAASKEEGRGVATFTLKPIDGVALATFVGIRGQQKAWRFGLEGIACERVHELGLKLVELRRGDGRRLSASWYRIEGGPLDQLLVKAFPAETEGYCNLMPGTPPYWEHQGEQAPG